MLSGHHSVTLICSFEPTRHWFLIDIIKPLQFATVVYLRAEQAMVGIEWRD